MLIILIIQQERILQIFQKNLLIQETMNLQFILIIILILKIFKMKIILKLWMKKLKKLKKKQKKFLIEN